MGLEPILVDGSWEYHPEPVPRSYGLVLILCSLFMFFVVNRIVYVLGVPSQIALKDAWKYRNLVSSWIHAMIVGTWDILCFVLYPEMVYDLIGFNNIFTYSMIAVSTGYFCYDFLDITLSGRYKQGWEVLLHHIAVSGTFLYNLMCSQCIAYTVVALLAEVNSFFLHSRKLMQMLQMSFDAPLYRFNVYVNLVTFFVCRFIAMVWIMYGMVTLNDRVSNIYMWVLGASMFVMWVINVILFWRLLANDIMRSANTQPVSSYDKPDSLDMTANNNGPSPDKLITNGKYDSLNHHIGNGDCHNYVSNGFKSKTS